MSYKKLLIAVDDSPFAAHAADAGVDLARQLGAEVAFVTVVDPALTQSAADSGLPAEWWLAHAQRDAKSLLNDFKSRAALTPPALEFLETGKPAKKIVETAKNWPADVIVMGTHGRGAIGSFMIGSVAQGVMRNAHCPVMILRAQK